MLSRDTFGRMCEPNERASANIWRVQHLELVHRDNIQ